MEQTQLTTSLDLPRRTRRYGFALTPLADAMFQLLIFFMLTSSLTAYSLLTIRSGTAGDAATGGGGQGDAPPALAADAAIWNIGEGAIVAGGQTFDFTALPDLARAIAATQGAQILLIARADAQVQDLTTVLEALTLAGVEGVQIASAQGGRE